ncbi:DEAD/DEAH box helicase [Variovorax sp. PCZ-1]|uniref:DEAD/DEAH box helicase n=1 Tax=Variovorax sp. PCZ-1 TaxID=2835533 RepID=UPI001BCF0D92|nr:DEAD/DEAH box helicase [Variovorax sp. PCZ-1]MBS7806215.1 DEAD/DEAH box helicase [Variovorax sp. PCZ-1]
MNDFTEEFKSVSAENNDVAGMESAPIAIEVIANEDLAEEAIVVPAGPNPFEELGLAPSIVKAIADLGYTQPTAVQARVVPLAMTVATSEGENNINDLMVSSQTGSGKTAAFLLPILHRLESEQRNREREESLAWAKVLEEAAAKGEAPPKKAKRKNPIDPRNFKAATPKALVLCPTRELAQQVANDAIELARHMTGVRVANVIGGLPYQIQIAKLQNADLVVATPGRLLDLQRNGQIKCEGVKCLVLDEADRMLDLGFSDDLAAIHQLTEKREQTMMFSATFAARIQQLATRVMRDNGKAAQRITIDSPQEKHANITQKLFWADNLVHKRKLLDHWMRETSIVQAIVFASTQIECDALAQDLADAGFDAAALHGALSQHLRNKRLKALRDGHIQFLVATDVAARGIDVPSISHVFNYGLPMKAEDYTHRIGRTGRAGRDGMAVTFAEPRDRFRIRDIEDYTRQQFRPDVIPGLEPTERVREKKPFGKFGNSGGGFAGRSNGGGFGGDRRGGFNDRGGDRGFAGKSGGGGFGGRSGGFGGDRGEQRSFGGDRGADRGGEGFGARSGGFGGGNDRGFGGRSDNRGFGGGFQGNDRGEQRNFAPRGDDNRGREGSFGGGFAGKSAGSFGGGERNSGGFQGNDRGDRGGNGFAGNGFKPRAPSFGAGGGNGFSGDKFGAKEGKSFSKPAGDFKGGFKDGFKSAPKPFAKSGFKPAGKSFASKAPRKP